MTEYCWRHSSRYGAAAGGESVLSRQEAPAGVKTGSHVTKVYDTAQTLCERMLARKDVAEQMKERLWATRAELEMTTLAPEFFPCQDRLDEIARRRQRLVIKKCGSYRYITGEFTA